MTDELCSGATLERARSLLQHLDQGRVSIAAYDTAWVARLPDPGDPSRPAFPAALDWLRSNQLPDGSWGAEFEYYHDRIISTLAAVVSLAQWDRSWADRNRCQRGVRYLHHGCRLLSSDPYETVGFELIVPTLAREAQQLGLDVCSEALAAQEARRASKLARIPPGMLYDARNPVFYSLEFMADEADLERIAGALGSNGSVGNSPSATAFYLRGTGMTDGRAWEYILRVMEQSRSGAVFSFPLDIFERSWVLYNLDLAGLLQPLEREARPHMDYLWDSWDPSQGVSFARTYPPCDLDDTAITLKLLRRAALLWGESRYRASLEVLRPYEEPDHFRTFPFETDPSITSNVHLLDALADCPEPEAGPIADRIYRFLQRTRTEDAFWFDKWHASPYYATAHTILAAAQRDGELVEEAVHWIRNTQRKDGSWGYYAESTVEETAYCLQALIVYNNLVGSVPFQALKGAARFLRSRLDTSDYPPLWIAKTLFAPINIIRSAALSALAMYEAIS